MYILWKAGNKWAATCDFQECSMFTSVHSGEPVQPHFKDRNSKWCSVSRFTITSPATSKDSDQTARMRRLIWGFAGRTYHIVGNLIRRPKLDPLLTLAKLSIWLSIMAINARKNNGIWKLAFSVLLHFFALVWQIIVLLGRAYVLNKTN